MLRMSTLTGTVSIHASVKDATKPVALCDAFYIVSIHASVKDATLHCHQYLLAMKVSIHASVKDATPCL